MLSTLYSRVAITLFTAALFSAPLNQATAQVTFVNQTQFTATSFNFNVPFGTKRMLLYVVTAEFNATTDNFNGATYGGIAMTQIGANVSINSGGKRLSVAAFYLLQAQIAAAGSNVGTIGITGAYTGGTESIAVEVFALDGVDQLNPWEDNRSNTLASSTTIDGNPGTNTDKDDAVFAIGASTVNTATYTAPPFYTEFQDSQLGHHSFTIDINTLTNNGTTDPMITSNTAGAMVFLSFEINHYVSPLPVELVSFEGAREGVSSHLTWNTASEINNDFFTLEKSEDGINFTEISRVDGAGSTNSWNYYDAYDHNPSVGLNYYRLTQTDFDGTVSQPHMTVVIFEEGAATLTVFYQNGVATAQVFSDTNNSLYVFDMSGKQVSTIPVEAGSSRITLENVSKGTYILRLNSATDAVAAKVVVE